MIVLIVLTVAFCFQNSIGLDVHHNYLSSNSDLKTPKNINYDVTNAKELFENFIQKHNKQYKDEAEFQHRYEIFVKNLVEINKMNQKSRSETYGITTFADLTVEEFQKGFKGLQNYTTDSGTSNPSRRILDDIEAPEELDYRQQSLVTSVRNQDRCSSCWAFSAVGVAEGQYAKMHGQLYSLSEQQLVDCWTEGGGCDTGSLPHLALNGVSQMGGFMQLSDYPYQGVKGNCAFRKESVVVHVQGGTQEAVNDEEQLKDLLYQYGPLSIAIYAPASLQSYTGNVYVPSDSECPPGVQIDHAVLLVGYGTDNGTPYWLIKNSWGEGWGENGYLKIIRGKNVCAIPSYVATAQIA